ncbi:triose-phosphate isomerase [Salinisphaera hydrothermalis]|uniref:Triosephosphate isomerase n=1 Tax=Salinisphaera hydrothermalis (strain C41B8) TaxID=1304275 RepID=A0A084IIW4_SALHC|nr:triose-phosphate isomerase family protein [Salinisphaera hydrothermalis]KEZ76648.1 triosephosphate isomerase [Salinisphaera hydrothermalis C41B8]
MHIGVSFKMYLDRPRTRQWCAAAAEIARRHRAVASGAVELSVFPTLPAMELAMAACADSPIRFGAQDLFWHDRGAYTGAVSGADLAEMGCFYAEIGHAERRRVFGDDDTIVARKVAAAVRNGLTPWLCIGEPEEGPVDAATAFCLEQLMASLAELYEPVPLVIAYEPVWAIGQSDAASAAHVAEVAEGLKTGLAERTGQRDVPVVYGGSAAPGTLSELGHGIDGLFLGRFAHDTTAFEAILDEAAELAN